MRKACCVFCDKDFDFDGELAYNATIWKSSGNYGSRLVDSATVDLGVDNLLLIICDNCLKLKKEKIFVESRPVAKTVYLEYTIRTLIEKLSEIKEEEDLWNKPNE